MSDKPDDLDKALRDIYESYYQRPMPRADISLDIYSQPETIIRVSVPVRFLWVCRSGHEHRFRLTAWLCRLLKGVK